MALSHGWAAITKLGVPCLLLSTALCVEAQPAIQFGGGGTWLPASHRPGIGAGVLAPSLLASIAPKDERVRLQAEFKLPLRHVTERGYNFKTIPYTIRFDRKDAVLSALGRLEANRHRRSTVAVLLGGSWITTDISDVTIYTQTSTPTDGVSRTRFAWTIGFDGSIRSGRFTAHVPQLRMHFPTGPDADYHLSIGGALSWSPTSKWAPARGGNRR